VAVQFEPGHGPPQEYCLGGSYSAAQPGTAKTRKQHNDNEVVTIPDKCSG
jgi:hypothetical protein